MRIIPESRSPRSPRIAIVLFAIAAVAIVAGGCGEDDADAGPDDVQGLGEVKVGSIASLAQCRDWNAGTEEEKIATIEDIREQINLEDAPVEAPTLSNDRAHELFEDACEPAYAKSFRLYKVYATAAAFSPLEDVTAAPGDE